MVRYLIEKTAQFRQWLELKFAIDTRDRGSKTYITPGDVRWCYLGLNIGSEQNGKGDQFLRPVILVNRLGPHLSWAVPLTRNPKLGKFYVPVALSDGSISGRAIISQLRVIDSKRLLRKIGRSTPASLSDVKKRIISLL